MTNAFLILALFFVGGSASAENAMFKHMTTCYIVDEAVFTVLRHVDDPHFGILKYTSANGSGSEQHTVEIAYTNAGARAIVVSETLPMLIVTSGGLVEVNWNDRTWNCYGKF